MAGIRDLLDRFRPVGAPGAATAVGVPADRVAEMTAELEPVFALLADVQQEAARVRRDAELQARRRQEDATAQAEAALAAARRRAAAQRAGAASAARERAADDSRALLARADEDARELLARARGRMPPLVGEVVAAVRQGAPGEAP